MNRLAVGALLALATLSGCNAVLGIEQPEPLPDHADDGDGGFQLVDAGPEADAALDAGPDGELPPAEPHARASWPMPNPASTGLPYAQSYALDQPGVVTDEVTKLVWQRSAASEPVDFDAAVTYCEQLSLLGGGFRLPTRIELTSLLDLGQAAPALDPEAFPDAIADKLWSSSPYAAAPNQRWLVNFGFGTGLLSGAGISEKHHVRCVRSDEGERPTTHELEVSEQTVRDPGTRLTWQRRVATEPVSALEAAAACAALSLDGGGYRLPTVKELHTLVDVRRIKTAIDPAAFPGTPSTYFWTSSKVAGFAEYTWMVSFTDGSDRWVSDQITGVARCVRSRD